MLPIHEPGGALPPKTILCIFGTRPEAIKMAPVIKELKRYRHEFNVIIVLTGQHTDMTYDVMDVFKLKADIDMRIMKPKQSLNYITKEVISRMEKVIDDTIPDVVLVHGDTTTSMATALASYQKNIKIGHVEAGLRSFDYRNPWPEEMNRVIVDRLSTFHFAPTETACKNLREEGIQNHVTVTGNTVIDALQEALGPDTEVTDETLDLLNIKDKIVLVTAHRRENWGTPLINICGALKDIVHLRNDVTIIYAVHPNPNVKDVVHRLLDGVPRIKLIDPPNYIDFANLMGVSYLVLTDSGGLQEEAPALGKPVLVMRETTERPEAIKAGTAKLIGTDRDNIRKNTYKLLTDEVEYNKMANAVNPYGDGTAAKKIVDALLSYVGNNQEDK